MKMLYIEVALEYDHTRVSPSEALFNTKRALDEYFNRNEDEYDEDALKVRDIRLNENVAVVSRGNQSKSF